MTTGSTAMAVELESLRQQLASRGADIATLRDQLTLLRDKIEKYLPECDHYSDNGVQFYAELLEALDDMRPKP